MLCPTSRRGRVRAAGTATLIALSTALLGAASASADSATIGPKDLTASAADANATASQYTFIQVSDSQQDAFVAPADGIISDWTVNFAAPGSVKLLAFAPQWDGSYVLQGSTPEVPANGTGPINFPVPLAVSKGWAIAVQLTNGAQIWARPDLGSLAEMRNDAAEAPAFEPLNDYDLMFNGDFQSSPSAPTPPTVDGGGLGGSGGGGDTGGGDDGGTGGNDGGGTGGNDGGGDTGNNGGGTGGDTGSGGGTGGGSTTTDTQSSGDTAAQQPAAQAQESSAQQPVYATTHSTQPVSRVTAQRSAAHMNRHGTTTIRLRCSAGVGCSGMLRLVLPLRHGKQLTLGKAPFSVSAGQTRRVTVRLTAAGRKAILRRHGATVLAVVTDRLGTTRSGLLLRVR